MTQPFSVTKARAQFPALQQSHQVYFDNAGGSQVLGTVSSSIKSYLEETNVQLGASYNVAKQSTEIHGKGLAAAASFMNAEPDEVVIGPSTTQLFSNLSLTLSLPPNSTLILSSLDHEANISSWVRLARSQNHTIKWWTPTSTNTSPILTPSNLRPLLDNKTALVCCTHASNVLGTIHDIKAIAEEVHKIPGARLCVDGVAYAPHGEVDVKELGVDFYSFSWYKVYGPHTAILYASPSALSTLSSLGHYFHTGTSLTTKLGLASASYELVAAIPAIISYFGSSPPERKLFWEGVAAHEERLQGILLGCLREREDKGVVIWGVREGKREMRVPVISFTVRGRGSRSVVEGIERRSGFGCRWGHFYSKRLVEEILGLGEEGVVRVSLVHYNTEEEVREYVKVLDEVLAEV
ncbi:hypothetical protein JMJ35_007013 [Cladonia borealis]|uniref:Aminotransferase class V domain-containing protein n=1 Tax=Cladonia borealis TaxID=184061 RepID=A0AA39U8P1_9LECA|nr:hypothetical protein JMJ35_007013 [Cladonia borealis]